MAWIATVLYRRNRTRARGKPVDETNLILWFTTSGLFLVSSMILYSDGWPYWWAIMFPSFLTHGWTGREMGLLE